LVLSKGSNNPDEKRSIEYDLPLARISEAWAKEKKIRYIEVKARARSGTVRLSANEGKKPDTSAKSSGSTW
jgi:hypothetical protein